MTSRDVPEPSRAERPEAETEEPDAGETPRDVTSPPCPSCGAPFGGLEECGTAFESLLARDFSGLAPYASHRLAVDAYSLQHPAEYMKSAKSAAAHLTGVAWAFDYAGSPGVGRALQRWLNGSVDVERPEPPPPARRGDVTLADVLGAEDPEEHARRVERWARSAWQAWSGHHASVRRWIREALGEGGGA